MTNNQLIVDVIQLAHGWATENKNGPERGRILIHKKLIDALIRRANINDNMYAPFDYWLIDGVSIREPKPNGRDMGSISEVSIKGKSVLRMSDSSFQYLSNSEID